MEQRSLRLGDLVDDYCPRERRVTNHVVVVLAGDAIGQTRCQTCEAEHEYKEAKVPRKKLKNGETSDLAGGVLVPKATPTNGAAPDEAAAPVAAAPASEPAPAPTVTAESSGDNETMPDG